MTMPKRQTVYVLQSKPPLAGLQTIPNSAVRDASTAPGNSPYLTRRTIIAYRVAEDQVHILTIIHMARQWPQRL